MRSRHSSEPRTGRHRLARWIGRLGGIILGFVLAWLLLEVLLRLLFFSLPPRLQLVLDDVRLTPFTDRKMLPEPIWRSDRDYLTVARAVQGHKQYGNAEVRFTVSTEGLWGSRAAFRTQQALVDRYVDAVVVGDSFTFCFTDEADCWVQQVAERAGRNLINLGIVSTGSQSHLRVLQDFGAPLQPPLVIWQWFGNDANEDYGLAVLRGETTLASSADAPAVPDLNWWDRHSAVYVLLKLTIGADDAYEAALQFHAPSRAKQGDIALAFGQPYLWGAFDVTLAHNQYGWERTQAALRDGRALVEGYDGALLVLLIPTKELVYREMAEPLIGTGKMLLLKKNYDQMLAFCETGGLLCFDALPVLREAATSEQLYYTTDMHLNARGNAVLAEALAEWLEAHPYVFEKKDGAS